MAGRNYCYLDFAVEPPAPQIAVDGTVAAAGDNENTIHPFRGGTLESNVTGALGTDLPIFTKDTQGHSIVALSGDGIGIEFGHSPLSTAPIEFTIGTDPAFFVKLRFDIPDVSEYDVAAVGFRAQAAYGNISTAATLNAYTDLACLNANAGNIEINTELNNGGLTTTDTGDDWADGEENTLAVYVSSAGVVTYQLTTAGGTTLAAPTTTAAFTFDDGDVVIPFIAFVATADTNGSPAILVNYEVGYQ